MDKKKIALRTLKASIISLCLLFGPSCARNIVHAIEKSDKEYELDNRDEMYNIIANELKELNLGNSVIAAKFITNMVLDGYFSIDEYKNKQYSIVDDLDYNIVINGPYNEKGIAELVCKMLNNIFGDEVEAYSMTVGEFIKTVYHGDSFYDKDATREVCLITDHKLNIRYVYSPLGNRFVRIDNLNFSTDNVFGYEINWVDSLITGKYDVFDLIMINKNNNILFPSSNFKKLSDKADQLYNLKPIQSKLYDINRLTASNKYGIYVKEHQNRIPE